MNRLTHKARYEAGYKANKNVHDWECIDKLGQLEDLEEQEKLLKLPCVMGNMTYWADKLYGRVRDAIVERIEIDSDGFWVITSSGTHSFDDFGKTVFLTRGEAETALHS